MPGLLVRGWTLALLLSVVLVAAGCGGGSGGRLTKKEFIARASATCKAFEAQQNDVEFPVVNPLEPGISHAQRARWALSLKQVVDLGREALKSLRRLNPPKELEDDFNRMLAQWSAAYDKLMEASVAAKEDRPKDITTAVPEGRALLDKTEQIAKSIGLPSCG